MARSIGVVECDCLSDVIKAADRMVKSADVRLVRQEQIGNSKVALVLEGETDDVERALAAAKEGMPPTLTTTLIPNIRGEVLNIFDLPGGRFWQRA
jgi:microcompartment protein CcmL/EutN